MGKQRFLPQPSSIVEFEQTKWPQQPESHNDGQLIQLLHLSHVPRDWALIFSQSSISLFGLVFRLFFLISLFHSILRLCSVHIRKPALSNCPFFFMLLTVWGSSVRVRPSATELISPILLNRCWHIVFVCILFIVASPWGLKTLCGRSHSFRYTSFTSAFWSSLVHRGNSLVGTMIG